MQKKTTKQNHTRTKPDAFMQVENVNEQKLKKRRRSGLATFRKTSKH